MLCAHNLQISQLQLITLGKCQQPWPSVRLVTLTSTWIIPDITRTSSNNCLLLFILRRVILLYLHNSSDDTHPYSIIVNYRHFSSYHFCLFCFTLLVYSLSFSFRKIIDRSILMKEIIIVYCCRLPKQCVFIWFQIHYLQLHNTDAFQSVCLKMATFSFVLASRPRQNDQKRSFKKGCLN